MREGRGFKSHLSCYGGRSLTVKTLRCGRSDGGSTPLAHPQKSRLF